MMDFFLGLMCFSLLVAVRSDSSDDHDHAKQLRSKEMKLWNDLFGQTGEGTQHYNKYMRPVANVEDSVQVSLGVTFTQLIEVDEKNNNVGLNAWLHMQWKDEFLAWNHTAYGVTSMRVPFDMIWRPDIILFNSAAYASFPHDKNALALVYPDGTVLWIPPVSIKASCDFNLRRFPFDTQTCILKFGSWTYHTGLVNITQQKDSKGLDDSYYMKHNEWTFRPKGVKTNNKKYDCCEERYADVTFKYTLKRKSDYYMCIFVAPAIFIGLIMPFMFLLPYNNKFSIGAGLMVSVTVLLSMLDIVIPTAHESVPIIAQYYVGLFGMLTLALLLSILTSSMAEKANYNKSPPEFLKTFLIGCLGRLVCIKANDYSMIEPPKPVNMNTIDNHNIDDTFNMDQDQTIIVPPRERSSTRLQWRLMALVLDRLFFLIFLVIIVCFMFSIL